MLLYCSQKKERIQDKTNRLKSRLKCNMQKCKVMRINNRLEQSSSNTEWGKHWRCWRVCVPWCDSVERAQRNRWHQVQDRESETERNVRTNDIHRKMKILLYKMKILLYKIKILLHKTKILLYRMKILLYRMKILLYRMKILLHRMKILLYRMKILLYRMNILLYRTGMWLEEVKKIWRSGPKAHKCAEGAWGQSTRGGAPLSWGGGVWGPPPEKFASFFMQIIASGDIWHL